MKPLNVLQSCPAPGKAFKRLQGFRDLVKILNVLQGFPRPGKRFNALQGFPGPDKLF